MVSVALLTKHKCPDCLNSVYLALTTTTMLTQYHPEHGTMSVVEGAYLDEDDALWQFSDENQRRPDLVCFACGWMS